MLYYDVFDTIEFDDPVYKLVKEHNKYIDKLQDISKIPFNMYSIDLCKLSDASNGNINESSIKKYISFIQHKANKKFIRYMTTYKRTSLNEVLAMIN